MVMSNKQFASFLAGVLLISISISLPSHMLGEHYAFSTHMVTHVMLLLVAAPLMVLSIPRYNRFQNPLKKISRALQQWPVLCWLTGIGIMWFWHIPVVYRHLMQAHAWQEVHHTVSLLNIVHVFSLGLAGIIFSWVVIGPYPQYRIAPLTGIFYLITACMGCSLLGLLITFAPDGLYTLPLTVNCGPGITKTINDEWAITQTVDRQVAGLIMWVPGCFIYLAGVLFLFNRWLNEKDETSALDLHFQNT
jgi:cytochrome c oxidase assembly factor CtaG